MKIYVRCGISVKHDSVYTAVQTERFKKILQKLCKYGIPKLKSTIDNTVDILCHESNYDILQRRLKFHRLTNFSVSISDTKYKNPYDIHVPYAGANNNNDLVIIFAYEHDTKSIILIDIGSHNKLNLSSSTILYQWYYYIQ